MSVFTRAAFSALFLAVFFSLPAVVAERKAEADKKAKAEKEAEAEQRRQGTLIWAYH